MIISFIKSSSGKYTYIHMFTHYSNIYLIIWTRKITNNIPNSKCIKSIIYNFLYTTTVHASLQNSMSK